ncbi:hypothetical protein [Burkholderia vietnamiensis]|uniref:hypothetical protein n=1 Tax=Burkholderia vietnamiensis TaxID=60552 RepID=UPI001D14521F|nr:hypothetical protein [Burkholderia vietnamiensis]UEC05568.1 hypothetical protein LK462_34595 [Burkholderia vietnamiensis]
MSGTIEQFPFGDENDGLDALAGENPPAPGGQPGGKPPVKQFPIKLFMIGFGSFVVVMVILIVVMGMMRRHSAAADQMADVPPQPQIQVPQPPAPSQVPPLPPGGMPQPAYQAGMNAMNPQAPQQVPSTYAQPATPTMQPTPVQSVATPSSPVTQQGPAQPVAAPQPDTAAPQPVQATPQPQPVAAQSAQPVAPQQTPQPLGPEPTPEPKHGAHPTAANQAPDVTALQRQLTKLQAELDTLRRDGGGRKVANIAAAKSTAGDADENGDAEGATQDTSSESKPLAHQRHAHEKRKPRGAQKEAAKSAGGKADTSYVLTGMVDNMAFVSRTGTGDVNSSMKLSPGDKLDDGRKVLQVDAKNRRVWLSGGSYIGLPPDSTSPDGSGDQ